MDSFENEVNDKINSLSKINDTISIFFNLLKSVNKYDIIILGTV